MEAAEQLAPGFPDEALLSILLFLEQRDIVKCQLVSKNWLEVAQAARKEAFLRRWGFRALITEPRTPSLLETIPPSSIVRRHVIRPGENVAQLALRYGTAAPALLRLNALMGPHLLLHRHEVYIPVSEPELAKLRGRCCAAFLYDTLLCRDLLTVVVQPPPGEEEEGSGEGERDGKPASPKFSRMRLREMQARVRRLVREASSTAAVTHGSGGSDSGPGSRLHGSDGAAVVDLCSGRYYLEEAGGCVEAAARMFVDDMAFGEQHPLRREGALSGRRGGVAGSSRHWDSEGEAGADASGDDASDPRVPMLRGSERRACRRLRLYCGLLFPFGSCLDALAG
ncbi:hypothetical protein Agub_g6347, partial [Astrephomene gubernaculifera]